MPFPGRPRVGPPGRVCGPPERPHLPDEGGVPRGRHFAGPPRPPFGRGEIPPGAPGHTPGVFPGVAFPRGGKRGKGFLFALKKPPPGSGAAPEPPGGTPHAISGPGGGEKGLPHPGLEPGAVGPPGGAFRSPGQKGPGPGFQGKGWRPPKPPASRRGLGVWPATGSPPGPGRGVPGGNNMT